MRLVLNNFFYIFNNYLKIHIINDIFLFNKIGVVCVSLYYYIIKYIIALLYKNKLLKFI